MDVQLPPALAKFVEDQVKSGRYADPGGVVTDAVRAFMNIQTADPDGLDELRRQVAVGVKDIEQGRVGEWDAEQIKAEGRRRLAARS